MSLKSKIKVESLGTTVFSIFYAIAGVAITSILVLSNFLPTIYFGALTGLAMLIALLAALTLLPRIILFWKPFGG